MHGIFLSAVISHTEYTLMRPLGAYRLASHLRDHGYDIQVIDFIHRLDKEQIFKLVKKFITPETKFIGLGMMIDYRHPKIMYHHMKMAQVFLLLKRQHPHIKFLMGGSIGFAWSDRWPNGEMFDYIIKGYGEDQTLALFDHYYKKKPHPPFEIIDGNKHLPEHLVISKDFNFTHSRHKWHDRDCIQPGEALPVEFARGCIFKCTFCKYPHIGKHKNDFTKDIENIKEELTHNYEKFGVTTYYVTDDTMNADTAFVKAFTDMAKSLPFKLQYGGFLRLDLMHGNPETVDMFLENGLESVYFGVESFQEDNAKMIGKAWSAKHGKTYLPHIYHNLWNKRIHISTGLIAGLPYETFDDLKKVNQWFIDNDMQTWLWHPLYMSRNSNYYKSEFDLNSEKYGFRFKIVEGKSIWVNDNCNQLEVIEWVKELQNDVKPFTGPTTWGMIELAGLGFNMREVAHQKWDQIPWLKVAEISNKNLENYVKNLMSL